MKAVQVMKHKKKTLDFININELPTPEIAENEVLVKMKAASLNPTDFHIAEGETAPLSPIKPPFILGVDGAGVIEAIGKQVTNFKVGDEVYFYTGLVYCGTFAEYIAIKASDCAVKPTGLSFEEAGASPLGLLCAYKAIKRANIQSGENVLIHGGSGNVGAAAVFLAKQRGAIVSATGNAADEKYVRSLGADEYIDYRTTQLKDLPKRFDMVLDGFGGTVYDESLPLLKPGVRIVSLKIVTGFEDMIKMGMKINWLFKWLIPIMFRKSIKKAEKAGVQLITLATYQDGADLTAISHLVDQAGFKSRIDKSFTLDQVKEALEYFSKGARGKVVITI